MIIEQAMMNYIMGATAIIVVVLFYNAFSIYRLKRYIKKQVEEAENEVTSY